MKSKKQRHNIILDDKKSLIAMIMCNYFFDLTLFRSQGRNSSKIWFAFLGDLKKKRNFLLRLSDLYCHHHYVKNEAENLPPRDFSVQTSPVITSLASLYFQHFFCTRILDIFGQNREPTCIDDSTEIVIRYGEQSPSSGALDIYHYSVVFYTQQFSLLFL